MSETLHSVVQQLEAERDRLGQLLEEKQAEATSLKVEVDRVQDALAALTSTSRQASPSKPSATRTDLLAIVHEVLTSRPSGVPAT